MIFVFDLDGTLVDTTELHAKTFVEAFLSVEGKRVSEEAVKELIGISGIEICKRLGARDPEAVYRKKTELFLARINEVKEIKGATRVLNELRKRGHQIMLATSSNRRMADALISNFGWVFDKEVTASDVENGKPATDMLVALGVCREPAVFVGDTDFDRKMAESCGLKVFILGGEIQCLEELLQLPEAKRL